MSIELTPAKCVGCGKCCQACPGNLLHLTEGKASIRDVRDCWGCTACVKACPKDAIAYYLAADLGGSGGRLLAHDSATELCWRLLLPDGSSEEIRVDKTKANEY